MADPFPNPGHDADMLRRAATACQNVMPLHGAEWFNWVPEHLAQMAARFDTLANENATPDSPAQVPASGNEDPDG